MLITPVFPQGTPPYVFLTARAANEQLTMTPDGFHDLDGSLKNPWQPLDYFHCRECGAGSAIHTIQSRGPRNTVGDDVDVTVSTRHLRYSVGRTCSHAGTVWMAVGCAGSGRSCDADARCPDQWSGRKPPFAAAVISSNQSRLRGRVPGRQLEQVELASRQQSPRCRR